MNPLRALIWKEGREAIYKIAIGACLGLFIGLVIYLNDDPTPGFIHFTFALLSHLVGFFGALLMGMDAVAGERSRGTLPFLFIRPLDRGRLLGVKFVVGAVGLLAVLAAYWAGAFSIPLGRGTSSWGTLLNWWGGPHGTDICTPVYLETNRSNCTVSMCGKAVCLNE